MLLNIKQELIQCFLGWMSNNFFWWYSQKRSLARRRRQNFLNPTWKKPNLWVIQAKNPTFQDFPGFHRCVSCNKPQFSRICKKKVALSRIFQDSRIFQEPGNPVNVNIWTLKKKKKNFCQKVFCKANFCHFCDDVWFNASNLGIVKTQKFG